MTNLIAYTIVVLLLLTVIVVVALKEKHDLDEYEKQMGHEFYLSDDFMSCDHNVPYEPYLLGKRVERTYENLSDNRTIMRCPLCVEGDKSDDFDYEEGKDE